MQVRAWWSDRAGARAWGAVGGQGVDVTSELAQLVLALPAVYADLVAILRGPALSEAVTYYADFVAFANGAAPTALLPVVHFVREHGNTAGATFAERFGLPARPSPAAAEAAAPATVAEPAVALDAEAEPAIDWGDGADDAGAAADVVIDWDVSDADGTTAAAAPAASTDGEVPELASAADTAAWSIEVEEAGQVDGSTALDDGRARALLLSDLLEVRFQHRDGLARVCR